MPLSLSRVQAAGVAAGIKKNGRKDLGLIVCDVPTGVAASLPAPGAAAPVQLDASASGSASAGR